VLRIRNFDIGKYNGDDKVSLKISKYLEY